MAKAPRPRQGFSTECARRGVQRERRSNGQRENANTRRHSMREGRATGAAPRKHLPPVTRGFAFRVYQPRVGHSAPRSSWVCSFSQTRSMIFMEHVSGCVSTPPHDSSRRVLPLHRPKEFRMPVPQP